MQEITNSLWFTLIYCAIIYGSKITEEAEARAMEYILCIQSIYCFIHSNII